MNIPQTNVARNRRKRQISELLAVIAIGLFSILVIDSIIAQGRQGFLAMDTMQKGRIFTIPPIILFFASFGLGYKQKGKLTTILLIVGGMEIVTFWLVAPTFGWFLFFYLVVRTVYNLIIVLGSIIIGLGVLRAIQNRYLNKRSELVK